MIHRPRGVAVQCPPLLPPQCWLLTSLPPPAQQGTAPQAVGQRADSRRPCTQNSTTWHNATSAIRAAKHSTAQATPSAGPFDSGHQHQCAAGLCTSAMRLTLAQTVSLTVPCKLRRPLSCPAPAHPGIGSWNPTPGLPLARDTPLLSARPNPAQPTPAQPTQTPSLSLTSAPRPRPCAPGCPSQPSPAACLCRCPHQPPSQVTAAAAQTGPKR